MSCDVKTGVSERFSIQPLSHQWYFVYDIIAYKSNKNVINY